MDRGGLIAVAALVLYVWTAPATVVFGDNAELSTLGTIGGVAHPSGYPLYLMWLRLWSWLPGSPAYTAAIATAILGALTVLVLHAACRAWGARPLAATITAGLFAVGPIVLRLHTEAEVFALNNLVCAMVLWLAARGGPVRGARRAILLALVAGLGLSNHLTCVLVAPIGMLGLVRGIREAAQPRWMVAVVAVGALGVGLLPYLYLLVTRATVASWGSIDDLPQLIRHIIRADYGGVGGFSPHGVEVATTTQIATLAASLGRSYLWAPALIGIAALGSFAVRGERDESRTAWILLAVTWLLAGPLLASRFNVEPTHLGLYVVQRFHLVPIVVLAIPIAVGLDRLGAPVVARLPERVTSAAYLRVVAVTGGLAAATVPSLVAVARVHSAALGRGLENILTTLPVGAVVIGSTDEFHFGMNYLQGALGLRLDVATITTPQLGLGFYRARLRYRMGLVVERVAPGSEQKLSVNVATAVLATGRPLFIDPYQANIATSFPSYPYGVLFRILKPGTPRLPIEEVFAINKALFERFQFDYPLPGPNDELATQFHTHYARTWRIIADALAHGGDPEHLAYAVAMAEALAPRVDP